MKILRKITILCLAVLSLSIVTKTFASVLPIAPATFETGLAFPLATTDTSLTLASANLTDGTALSGFVCLTIDIQQPNTEYVCGTASSTSPTTIMNLTRGIDTLDGTTSVGFLIQSHRRGADVRITNYPFETLIGRLLSGVTTFDNILTYTGLPTFTGASQLVDKNYVDSIAFSGAGVINATTAARGIVQLATSLQVASSTSVGSSGAFLDIPASDATSTFNTATAALRVVVTRNNGTIDPGFIPPISNIQLASTSAFSNGIPLMSIGKNHQIFSSTGTSTFVVPSGLSVIHVRIIGGGGGGGGAINSSAVNGGAGGGGGGYAEKDIDVTATTSIQLFVASGGGTSSGSAGSTGGTTFFGTNGFYMSALGGSGGGAPPGPSGGQGGCGSGGDLNTCGGSGGPGEAAVTATASAFSGSGGSSALGGGGNGLASNSIQAGGIAGLNYGGGGSGGIQTGSSGSNSGGSGAQGVVIISW